MLSSCGGIAPPIPPADALQPKESCDALLRGRSSLHDDERIAKTANSDAASLSLPSAAGGCRLTSDLEGDDLLDLKKFSHRLALPEGEWRPGNFRMVVPDPFGHQSLITSILTLVFCRSSLPAICCIFSFPA